MGRKFFFFLNCADDRPRVDFLRESDPSGEKKRSGGEGRVEYDHVREGESYRRDLETRSVVGVVPQHGHTVAVSAGARHPAAAAAATPGSPATDPTCACERRKQKK